jgi:hypothetical protein
VGTPEAEFIDLEQTVFSEYVKHVEGEKVVTRGANHPNILEIDGVVKDTYGYPDKAGAPSYSVDTEFAYPLIPEGTKDASGNNIGTNDRQWVYGRTEYLGTLTPYKEQESDPLLKNVVEKYYVVPKRRPDIMLTWATNEGYQRDKNGDFVFKDKKYKSYTLVPAPLPRKLQEAPTSFAAARLAIDEDPYALSPFVSAFAPDLPAVAATLGYAALASEEDGFALDHTFAIAGWQFGVDTATLFGDDIPFQILYVPARLPARWTLAGSRRALQEFDKFGFLTSQGVSEYDASRWETEAGAAARAATISAATASSFPDSVSFDVDALLPVSFFKIAKPGINYGAQFTALSGIGAPPFDSETQSEELPLALFTGSPRAWDIMLAAALGYITIDAKWGVDDAAVGAVTDAQIDWVALKALHDGATDAERVALQDTIYVNNGLAVRLGKMVSTDASVSF